VRAEAVLIIAATIEVTDKAKLCLGRRRQARLRVATQQIGSLVQIEAPQTARFACQCRTA